MCRSSPARKRSCGRACARSACATLSPVLASFLRSTNYLTKGVRHSRTFLAGIQGVCGLAPPIKTTGGDAFGRRILPHRLTIFEAAREEHEGIRIWSCFQISYSVLRVQSLDKSGVIDFRDDAVIHHGLRVHVR